MFLKLTFMPFFQPSFDDEEEEAVAEGKAPASGAPPKPVLPSARSIVHKVSDKLKVRDWDNTLLPLWPASRSAW